MTGTECAAMKDVGGKGGKQLSAPIDVTFFAAGEY